MFRLVGLSINSRRLLPFPDPFASYFLIAVNNEFRLTKIPKEPQFIPLRKWERQATVQRPLAAGAV